MTSGRFSEAVRLQARVVDTLPGDPISDPTSDPRPRQVQGACYSLTQPTPVPKPRMIARSREVMAMLEFPEDAHLQPDFAEVFSGNQLLPGSRPYAACYGGHQFGNWAGQLGDGRAITLGERQTSSGERFELQLKGAGRTPYSRGADGRAVMRSSVREFLCSEAMHHLGVPTTRALSLVETGAAVTRDVLYDGHPRDEPGAIVCRVAPSFLRFGSYQIFTSRNDATTLRTLLDDTLVTHFQHLGSPSRPAYLAWFEGVCRATVEMVVHWMRVGFVHGVMNTDNMSIHGLTIDYGPYGFIEPFDLDWTPNTTDAEGRRYRFGHQPAVALWNLVKLAEAILPLIEMAGPLEDILRTTSTELDGALARMWLSKLGLSPSPVEDPDAVGEDEDLVESLHALLQRTEIDMALFFRGLGDLDVTGPGYASLATPADPGAEPLALSALAPAYYDQNAWADHGSQVHQDLRRWLSRYRRRVEREGLTVEDRRERMAQVNPLYLPRNYLVQLAIDDAEKGDGGAVMELLDVLRKPYQPQPGRERYAEKRPEWARHRVGCSMLSCSS